MPIVVEVRGDREVAARFDRLSEAGHRIVVKAINQLRVEDEALVKQKLSGDVLNVRSGALRSSIFSEMTDDGQSVVATIKSSGDVKYAGIHEFGGVIDHPGGTAYVIIAGKGAMFVSNESAATMRIAGRTRPHEIVMPERSYLRSALKEMTPRIKDVLEDAVAEAVRGP